MTERRGVGGCLSISRSTSARRSGGRHSCRRVKSTHASRSAPARTAGSRTTSATVGAMPASPAPPSPARRSGRGASTARGPPPTSAPAAPAGGRPVISTTTSSAGVPGQRRHERHQVGHVVDHVRAHDDVAHRDGAGDVGPDPVVRRHRDPALGRRRLESPQHRRLRVDGVQPADGLAEPEAARPGAGTDVEHGAAGRQRGPGQVEQRRPDVVPRSRTARAGSRRATRELPPGSPGRSARRRARRPTAPRRSCRRRRVAQRPEVLERLAARQRAEPLGVRRPRRRAPSPGRCGRTAAAPSRWPCAGRSRGRPGWPRSPW